MYKRILVATDGSDLSAKAVESAIALASSLKAELFAVKVVHRVYGPWPSLQAEEVPAGHGAQVGQEGLVVVGGRDEGGAVGDPHDQGGEHGVEGAPYYRAGADQPRVEAAPGTARRPRGKAGSAARRTRRAR